MEEVPVIPSAARDLLVAKSRFLVAALLGMTLKELV